jgi:hypothetical protein
MKSFPTLIIALALGAGFASCGTKEATGPTCTVPVTGAKWVPTVPGASSTNHDAGVTETVTVSNHTGPITGLDQAVKDSQLISVTIDMTDDLGSSGSLTLQARGTSMPAGLIGSAAPFLISLSDGTNEYVNLSRGTTATDCNGSVSSGHPQGTGIYDCSGSGGCVTNAACKPKWPSAFTTRDQWEQHQLLNSGSGFPSVNTFPTCNWSTALGNVPGADAPSDFPKCAFSESTTPAASTGSTGVTPWLVGGKLKTGMYTAKFALIATRYAALGSSYTGGFELTVVKKKTGATLTGAVDLNVVLVGTTNVNASRTVKGQQNLDTLFGKVAEYYNQAGTGIKLGTVTAYEWPCETGGDAYAAVGTAGLGDMFTTGAGLYPGTTGKALNIFLTSTITNDVSSLGAGVIIDGYSGGINGPVTNGTSASGLVFATFDRMGENAPCKQSNKSDCVYNPNCPSGAATCAVTEQEEPFWNMETTVTHEMGHYLGLNHPNESDGTVQDALYDTPTCTTVSGTAGIITINSCLHEATNQKFSPVASPSHSCVGLCTPYNSATGIYCETIQECSFNHIMWYTSKNFTDSGASKGLGDGNLFSPETGVLLNYSPFVQ